MDLFEQAYAARYVSLFCVSTLVYMCVSFFLLCFLLFLQKTNKCLKWVPNSSKRARRCEVDVFLAKPNNTNEVFDSDVDTDIEAPTAKVNRFIYYLLFIIL